MSNRYSIYLSNRYGSTNTYGFFTSPPESSSQVTEVFSNVWISQALANSGSAWIRIEKTYNAWCGTSPSTLAPGVQVTIGNSKAVDLGTTTAKGTTTYMYNLNQQPAFLDNEGATANSSCFEIDSSDDFLPEYNFLMGMAAVDMDGRMVPIASFEAPRNAQVNIAPHADYYISAFDTEQGTAIDFKEQSKDAAHIDFESNPGMYGATVTHQNNGDFTVTYAPSRDEYLHLIEHIKRDESSLEQKVDKLARQLSTVVKYLPAAAAAEPELDHVASRKAIKANDQVNGC